MNLIKKGMFLLLAFFMATATVAFAHCDGLDGPVVQAARQALDSRDVNLILIWVRKDDEPEIKKAFEQTLAVRKLGRDAARLADNYFFETVVRVHRAGEGAAFTGLIPTGRDLGPAIPEADRALHNGDIEPTLQLLNRTMEHRVREAFDSVQKKKDFPKDDVIRGREFVDAYVTYIHLVERIYQQTNSDLHGHYKDGAANMSDESDKTLKNQHSHER